MKFYVIFSKGQLAETKGKTETDKDELSGDREEDEKVSKMSNIQSRQKNEKKGMGESRGVASPE